MLGVLPQAGRSPLHAASPQGVALHAPRGRPCPGAPRQLCRASACMALADTICAPDAGLQASTAEAVELHDSAAAKTTNVCLLDCVWLHEHSLHLLPAPAHLMPCALKQVLCYRSQKLT